MENRSLKWNTMENKDYVFCSLRLGFRNWTKDDLDPMAQISQDAKVMEFFPDVQTKDHTAGFIKRMQDQFEQKGYCYFAVDELKSGEFIGFIGICDQNWESDYTPCIDIGWRLRTESWGKGFATEGAKSVLRYANESLEISEVRAFAPLINSASINVMEKIGMIKLAEFNHPLLTYHERLKLCVCFGISY